MTLQVAPNINFWECDTRCIKLAQKLAERFKVTVTSGKRSIESNKACGGKPNSQHLAGTAIDLRIDDVHISKWGYFILSIDPTVGAIGIDVYRNVMHIDYRITTGNIITWVYDREGKAI